MRRLSLLLILLATSIAWISCERTDLQQEMQTTEQNLKSDGPGDPPGGGEPCGATEAQQSAENCNLTEYSNDDFNNMYFVRDSMFTFTTKGQEYISHYYDISEFISDNGIFDSCEEFEENFYQAHLDGYTMIANYLNPLYSDTLITNALYTQLKAFSTELRNYDSTNAITSILDDVESDLNYLKNKPASDVRDFFD